MIKIPYKTTLSFFLISLMMLFLYTCARDSDRGSRVPKVTKTDKSSIVIPEVNPIDPIDSSSLINFYFENSASMKGYLEGRNFKQTMHEIIDESDPDLIPYFVNTREFRTSDLLSKIDNKKISTPSIGGSDHEFIFENAINNATSNNLSIVVTDGIYSTPKGDVDIVEIEIKKSFVKALEVNAIETVVIKMSSNFKGRYYRESDCDGPNSLIIDQERPYYIILFGNKETIDNALQKYQIEELPGFKKQARFFVSNDFELDYTILTKGEEINGKFRPTNNGGNELIKEIGEAERKRTRGGVLSLQFAVAVDFTNVSIPKTYLENPENYKKIGGTGYVIKEIKLIEDLSPESQTYKFIQNKKTTLGIKLSHIIIVNAELNATGELIIQLDNNLPSWITTTSQPEDCIIEDNTEKTFAFKNLMTGISKAYIKVDKKSYYKKFNFIINHN